MDISKLTLAVVLALAGCISQILPINEYAKGWIGAPIEDLITAAHRPQSYPSRIGWKDQQYKLDGGLVYVFPEREDCVVHWHVNQGGIIVGYHTEGGHCD